MKARNAIGLVVVLLSLGSSGCDVILGFEDTRVEREGGADLPSPAREAGPEGGAGAPPTGAGRGGNAGSATPEQPETRMDGGMDAGMDAGMDSTVMAPPADPPALVGMDAAPAADGPTADAPETGPIDNDIDGSSEPPDPPPHVWTPAEIPDLVLWLDAASGVTTAGPSANQLVSRWSDRSGRGHDALQTQAPNQPVWRSGAGPNGLPAVVFSPTNTWVAVADAPELNVGTGDFTLEIVAAWTTPAVMTPGAYGYAALFNKQHVDVPRRGFGAWANTAYELEGTPYLESRFGLLIGGVYQLSGAVGLNDGRYRLCAASRIDGTRLETRINGNIDGNFTTISADLNGDSIGSQIILGANPGDTSQALTGSIAEIVLVRGHLDRAQIQQLEAYLLQKHGF